MGGESTLKMKLYWPIDRLIDSYTDWSLTEPSWDGRELTSGLIQYDPIQYSLWFFFFFHVQIFVAKRGHEKKNNRNTHESIIAVIQWLSMNSESVCHSLWVTGLTEFKWGFEVQHCHLWIGVDAAGSWQITSSSWGHWCVFLRCCGLRQRKADPLVFYTGKKKEESLKSICWLL